MGTSNHTPNNMQQYYDTERLTISSYAEANGLVYKRIDNDIYVLSDIAYWRITYLKEWDSFVLYHGNTVPTDLNISRYREADYHYQKDVKPTISIMNMMVYIKRHDDFRADQIRNVEAMSRRTKKDKAKYAKMKQKQQAYNNAKVIQLINAIGSLNDNIIAVGA